MFTCLAIVFLCGGASHTPAMASSSSSSSSSSCAASRSSLLGLAMVPALLASPPSPHNMDLPSLPDHFLEDMEIPRSPPSPFLISRPRISLLADEKQPKQPRIFLHSDGEADTAPISSSPICAGSLSSIFPLAQLSTSLPSSFQACDESEESENERSLPITPRNRIISCSRDLLAAPRAARKAYRAAPLRRHQPRRLQFGDDEAVHDRQPSCLSNMPAASAILAVSNKSSAPSFIEDACKGIAPLEIADNVGEPSAFQRDESNSKSPRTPPAARFDSFACGNTPMAPKKPFGRPKLERG